MNEPEQPTSENIGRETRGIPRQYVNALHADVTPEEVQLTLGVNAFPVPRDTRGGRGVQGTREPVFEPNTSLVMNYHTAKRLMVVLAQILQHYEQQFGEVPLDPTMRAKPGAGAVGAGGNLQTSQTRTPGSAG